MTLLVVLAREGRDQTMTGTYVWTGVMCDYTCGMASVNADSEEEAYATIRESDIPEYVKKELLSTEPKRLEDSEVAWVYGGG